jgi:hypothetical protein
MRFSVSSTRSTLHVTPIRVLYLAWRQSSLTTGLTNPVILERSSDAAASVILPYGSRSWTACDVVPSSPIRRPTRACSRLPFLPENRQSPAPHSPIPPIKHRNGFRMQGGQPSIPKNSKSLEFFSWLEASLWTPSFCSDSGRQTGSGARFSNGNGAAGRGAPRKEHNSGQPCPAKTSNTRNLSFGLSRKNRRTL